MMSEVKLCSSFSCHNLRPQKHLFRRSDISFSFFHIYLFFVWLSIYCSKLVMFLYFNLENKPRNIKNHIIMNNACAYYKICDRLALKIGLAGSLCITSPCVISCSEYNTCTQTTAHMETQYKDAYFGIRYTWQVWC